MAALEWIHFKWLPTPMKTTFKRKGRASSFPGGTEEDVERVRVHLDALTSLGPRVTGSIQLHTATNYLLRTLERMRSLAQHVEMEVEHQKVSGHFDSAFLDGMSNVYSNVSNVIVRLRPKPSSSSRGNDHKKEEEGVNRSEENVENESFATLLNAHYDTVPTSAGASDDALGCAVMMETIASILRRQVPLTAPIIFLFNGAEESHQLAAHGFITSHRWAPSVWYLMNLESIGGGGRELIFQCNSAAFIELYAKSVPFPKGNVIASELFSAILWRSAATDWRTFVQFSGERIIGTDSAYTSNGHIYHTQQDSAEVIRSGTIVNTLSNVIAMVEALQEKKDSLPVYTTESSLLRARRGVSKTARRGFESVEDDEEKKERERSADRTSVFFSFPGLFFVAYSGTTALSLHTIIAIIGFLYASSLSSTSALFSSLLTEVSALIAALLSGAMTGLILSFLAPMKWYANGLWIAVLCYAPPSIATVLLVRNASLSKSFLQLTPLTNHPQELIPLSPANDDDQPEDFKISSPSYLHSQSHQQSSRSLAALLLLWSLLLILGTWSGVMSSYCLGFLVVFPLLGHILFQALIHRGTSLSHSILAYLICLTPAALHWIELFYGLMDMLLPLLGKSGTTLNSDVALGVIISFFSSVFCQLTCVHLITSKGMKSLQSNPIATSSPRRVLHGRTALIVGYIVAIGLVTLLLPSYSALSPKRLWLQHISRIMCSDDHISSSTCTSDAGIWITGFDELGLWPIIDTGIADFGIRNRASACAPATGECYQQWPWSYPVAHLMGNSLYISSSPPASIPDALALNMTLISEPGLPFNSRRSITVYISGPTHLRLIVRDGQGGSRIVCWSLNGGNCISPPSARFDGSRYMQLICGQHGEVCRFSIRLEVLGKEKIELTAHADYTAISNTAELLRVRSLLPNWASGAEWTNFASSLVSMRA